MSRTGEPQEVPKSRSAARPRASVSSVLDYVFFVFGGVSAVWLAWLVLTESFEWGWFLVVFFILFWVVLAVPALITAHALTRSVTSLDSGYWRGDRR